MRERETKKLWVREKGRDTNVDYQLHIYTQYRLKNGLWFKAIKDQCSLIKIPQKHFFVQEKCLKKHYEVVFIR